ncbi:DUF7344 domain-containing protein [Halomicrobium salinisoli]|uniref:DUF7344 domain-containing protein n=1 Tax=Halomicrobium salinisoli TaxID=2878391 RepID=UPI001CF01F64|nr:hypothetical protein [Halomicrobium salinisoli]
MGGPDAVYRALVDERRRIVLSVLRRHHTVPLPDLAESVAESEFDEDVAAISGESIRDVYMSLYHTHVPLLEAADLVRYEQADDVVAWTGATEDRLSAARDRVDALLDD